MYRETILIGRGPCFTSTVYLPVTALRDENVSET